MAKVEIKKALPKKTSTALPFTRENFIIFAIGLVVITLGYLALSQSPWDGTLPLVVAPILLVLGYCVIIPIGIIYRKRKSAVENIQQIPSEGKEIR